MNKRRISFIEYYKHPFLNYFIKFVAGIIFVTS